jgi:hypothetical protein
MVRLPPFSTPNLDGQAVNNRCGGTDYEVTGIDYTVDTSKLESISGAEELRIPSRYFGGIPKLGDINPGDNPRAYKSVLESLEETANLSEEMAGAYTDAISDAGTSIKDGWDEFTDAVRDGEWSDAAGAAGDIIESAKGVGDNISDALTDVITNTDVFNSLKEISSEVGIKKLEAAAALIGADMAHKFTGGVFYDGSISIKIDVKFTKRFFEEQLKKLEFLNQRICIQARADGSMGFVLEIDHNTVMDPRFEAKLSAGIYAVLNNETLDGLGMQLVGGAEGQFDVITGDFSTHVGLWVENTGGQPLTGGGLLGGMRGSR